MDKEKARKIVREAYGKIVEGQDCCCGDISCGSDTADFAKSIGYSEEELQVIPEESNLALSCGNPTALANLGNNEIVLDLGSGAGFDCFLAAAKVGPQGKVIGVDMTPEMLEKARANAKKSGVENVEFRLGEIENIPVADSAVDVVISNCVINLSADKPRVFQEIYRVLKPGGRVAVSDIALLKELPRKTRESIEAYVGCVGGALTVDALQKTAETSGLHDVTISVKGSSACICFDTKDPIGRAILDSLGENESLDDYVVSVFVEGFK
ncbi:MAG: arsenite methyltransferase [Chlorobiales bacterium]|nr:arsenite methyltransferase [Chlorobiales bacterium]